MRLTKNAHVIAACLAFACSCGCIGQQVNAFHNCSLDGSTGNLNGYQTASETYKCDEGLIELNGRWSMTVEYGYVFRTQLGRPEGEPFPEAGTEGMFKWCPTPKPWDKNQKELCGLIPPKKCWDGKPPRFDSTGDWTCVDKAAKP
jgi:hypothetical protein